MSRIAVRIRAVGLEVMAGAVEVVVATSIRAGIVAVGSVYPGRPTIADPVQPR